MDIQISTSKDSISAPPLTKRPFRPAGVVAAVAAFVLVFATALISGAIPNNLPFVGKQNDGSIKTDSSNGGQLVSIEIRAKDMAFTPNQVLVPADTKVELILINDDNMPHDLVTEFGGTTILAPGQRGSFLLPPLSTPIRGWCSIPGHRQAGMELEIIPQEKEAGVSSEASGSSVPGMSAFLNTPADFYVDPVLPAVQAKTTHEVTFTVSETEMSVGAGLRRPIWTFNGGPVGPTLRGKLGDKFVVTLKNEGTMAHSIDFHASYLAPDQPMRSIQPGESLVYEFVANRAGIWMYHCSTAPMSMHIAAGMYGAVVIDPPDLEPVDFEYIFVQSEIYLPTVDSPVSVEKLRLAQPDLMAFNGVPYQYRANPIEVPVGKKVRAWVLAVGPNLGTSFHVVGSQFDTTWAEGRYLLRNGVDLTTGLKGGGSQALGLTAAQGGFVEFVLPEPGNYAFVDHSMVRAEQGAVGIFTAK